MLAPSEANDNKSFEKVAAHESCDEKGSFKAASETSQGMPSQQQRVM